jgi:hypothetical protein
LTDPKLHGGDAMSGAFLVRLAVVALMGALLAGCVQSSKAIYSTEVAEHPAPEQSVAVNGDTLYALQHNGSDYDFIAGAPGFRSARFVGITGAPNFYVLQLQNTDSGYYYVLVEFRDKQVVTYDFQSGALARRSGITPASDQGDTTAQIENRPDMNRFFIAAYNARSEAQTTVYRLLDFHDPADQKEAEALYARLEAKSPTTDADKPKQSGAWSLSTQTDTMSDATTMVIAGQAASWDGPLKPPSLAVGCGPNGVTVSIYWGTTLADMYPNEDTDFVDVQVRFDSDKAFDLGWQPSNDWTRTYPPDALTGGLAQLGEGLLRSLFPDLGEIAMVWEPLKLHQNLKLASKFAVRAVTRDGGYATIVFDMQGYREVARNFPNQCS